jgi:hypothetical protein
MLPDRDELTRALTVRTAIDAERTARERGFLQELRAQRRPGARPADRPGRSAEADGRPCPPPCPERAPGLAG